MSRSPRRDDPPGLLYSPGASLILSNLQDAPAKSNSRAVISICGSFFLLACAAQGPPRPPRIQRPERITGLSVAQLGRNIEISFTLPALAEDGERLTKPLEVEVFRSIVPAGQKPPTGEPELQPWTTLRASDLSRSTNDQKVNYTAALSEQEFSQWEGATFTFELRASTRGFRRRPLESQPSNTVYTVLLDVSEPVQNLEVRPTEKALELRWSPPARSLSGRPPSTVVKYRIYRSASGAPGSFLKQGEALAPAFRDAEFSFDHSYFYKVRAVAIANGREAESEDSQIVSSTPHDVYPPAAPTGLTAVFGTKAVELIWTANSEPDLAGYNVYRREKDTASQRLNQKLLLTPTFVDPSVAPRHEYFYRVTALDLNENESQPSEEAAVETR